MGNTFGHLFRITTFGESHGPAVGVVIDGCPARLPLPIAAIQAELDRRRPGQSALSSARQEADQLEVLSGISEGMTLGTPIALVVRNKDARSQDYTAMRDVLRPSHADFTYAAKYGIRAWQGGGRASARETVGRVAAGAVAKVVLQHAFGVEVLAWVQQIHTLCADIDAGSVTRAQIEAHPTRCPDAEVQAAMQARITEVRAAGDSVGGVIQAVGRGLPAGWGEPVFDKLEAALAQALLSIPACRGFSIGSGFDSASMLGSEHNDAFVATPDARSPHIRTATNRSGGVQGGISNGQDVVVRAAFKPTATINRAQQTVDSAGTPRTLAAKGRHDPCVLPRAVPIVEAMMALVLVDCALLQRAKQLPDLRA
jgi:chorismate synthase